MSYTNRYTLTWLAPVAAGAFCVMLLRLFAQRPVTYELNIYSGLNAYAFVPLALVAALAYLWVIRGRLWAFNVIVITFCIVDLIFTSLPTIKGYYSYGQFDGSAFVGYTIDILRTGRIFHEDFYPLSHILVAQLSFILPADPRYVRALLTPIWWGIFALGSALAANQIESLKGPLAGGIARCLACVFWLPAGAFAGLAYLLPFTMTLELSPMVMYLLLGRPSLSRILVLMILLLSMTFYHPLTIVLFAVSLLVASLFVPRPRSSGFRLVGGLIMISILGWIFYFTEFAYLVTGVSSLLTGETTIGGVAQTASELNLSLLGKIELVSKLYGHGLFELGLVALSFVILKKYVKNGRQLRAAMWTFYPFLLVSFGLMVPLLFLGSLGFSPFRFYFFAVMVSVPVAIWAFLYVVKRIRHVRVARFLAVTIIVVLWVSSIMSLHPSPYLSIGNEQITQQMIAPLQWLYGYHPDYVIQQAPLGVWNTRDMYSSVAGINESRAGYYQLDNMPYHFDNGNVSAIMVFYGPAFYAPAVRSAHSHQVYVVIDASVFIFYEQLYPHLPRYTQEDLQVLLSNPMVLKVYDNGETQVEIILQH